ncbi:MAG: DUF4082 domain-containing protein [Acidobacteriota bacterium]
MLPRGSRVGRWLAGGGAALQTLVLLTGAAIAVLIGSVVPRFESPQLSLPLQQTLVYPGSTPLISSIEPGAPVELGVVFRPTAAGSVIGIRAYRFGGEAGPLVGHLWSADGTLLGVARFPGGFGWQEAQLSAPVQVAADSLLMASYFSPSGGNIATGASFRKAGVPIWFSSVFQIPPASKQPLNFYHDGGTGFPTSDAGDRTFWIDVVFVEASPSDAR